jgi:hypothetical protein
MCPANHFATHLATFQLTVPAGATSQPMASGFSDGL